MANLLTIQPQTVLHHYNNNNGENDESLSMDEFFKDNLEPLMKKFKHKLRERGQLHAKVDKVYRLFDNFTSKWEERYQKALEMKRLHTPPDLMHVMMELSKKYHEFEHPSDEILDAILIKMEELDNKISDALKFADKMRERVEEKFYEVAGVATEQIDQLKHAVSSGSKRLLMYEELPDPWRNNEYIRTGYRFLGSAAECWYSLFYFHNETCNIWTHLLGFIGLFSIGIYELFFSDRMANVPLKDQFVFVVFILAACKCLMCSTVWHTLSGISNLKVYRQVACLDYVGISVLICASIMLCEYYGFYCDEPIRNIYITATSTLAVIGMSMPFQAWFDKHELRWLRIAFFVALASTGAIIIGHLALVRGAIETFSWLLPVFKSLACYIAGVIIYGNQFPEKFWPGKFDRIGHSHQFWHLFVCGGIWYHYQAALVFSTQRENFAQCSFD